MSVKTISATLSNEEHIKTTFMPVAWLKKIEFIKRLIADNNLLIALLGEEGSGKTTFFNHMCAGLPELLSFRLTAKPSFDESQLEAQFCRLLKRAEGSTLGMVIAQYSAEKKHVLVIIDDAHFLTIKFIEALLQAIKQQGDGVYFHVCLAADFSLVKTLNDLAEDKYRDLIHSVELGPLTEAETKKYVEDYFLNHPHMVQDITLEQHKAFYQLTEGHLLRINHKLPIHFTIKSPDIVVKETRPLFNQVMMMTGMLVLGLALIFTWQKKHSTQSEEKQLKPISSIVLEEELPKSIASYIPAYYDLSLRQTVLATPLQKNVISRIDEEHATFILPHAVVDKVIVAPKYIAKSAKKVSKLASLVKVERVITRQARYTIQLLASHRKDKLKRFATTHHIQGDVQFRHTERYGKDWYLLTLGEFGRQDHAKSALDKLPKEIADYKPWVRLIKDIKEQG
jgi:DamX protein